MAEIVGLVAKETLHKYLNTHNMKFATIEEGGCGRRTPMQKYFEFRLDFNEKWLEHVRNIGIEGVGGGNPCKPTLNFSCVLIKTSSSCPHNRELTGGWSDQQWSPKPSTSPFKESSAVNPLRFFNKINPTTIINATSPGTLSKSRVQTTLWVF